MTGWILVRRVRFAITVSSVLIALALTTACGHDASLPVSAGFGPAPTLPAPQHSLIPTVNVVDAIHWSPGEKPTPAAGLSVAAYATGLVHPRFIYVLPNGDVLVSETNAPPRPDDNTGIKGWFFKHFQKKAGGGVPSPNKIILLRDANGDGIADRQFVLLSGLNSPFGITLVDSTLIVANTNALVKFHYSLGDTIISSPGTLLTALPAGTINHHWTKSVIASPDGSKLYIGVGSNSNAAENGIAVEAGRSSIWEVDTKTGAHREYASGLRNPVGLAWEATTGALWVSVNERDELGGDLVPDYMTAVRDGAFYGWPYSYYGQHVDERVKPQKPELVAKAIVPDYALGDHTASLGLASSGGNRLSPAYANGMFVGQHGSWNRKPRSGYKVIFVPFASGRPSGPPLDVLSGFVKPDGKAMGRPVGVAVDRLGGLLVADDVGNTVWRVSAAMPSR